MSEPRVVAIIQARLGATRLPGKVLLTLGGMTVLALTVRRLQRARTLVAALVATSDHPRDAAIAAECADLGVPCFRGSETDVLDRYARAAAAPAADHIVRVTADCPLICPELVDDGVRRHLAAGAAFTSNNLVRSFAHGVDFQVVSRAALEAANRASRDPFEREHVIEYHERRPQEFATVSVTQERDDRVWRITLDTLEDYAQLHALCRRLADPVNATYAEIIAALAEDHA